MCYLLTYLLTNNLRLTVPFSTIQVTQAKFISSTLVDDWLKYSGNNWSNRPQYRELSPLYLSTNRNELTITGWNRALPFARTITHQDRRSAESVSIVTYVVARISIGDLVAVDVSVRNFVGCLTSDVEFRCMVDVWQYRTCPETWNIVDKNCINWLVYCTTTIWIRNMHQRRICKSKVWARYLQKFISFRK